MGLSERHSQCLSYFAEIEQGAFSPGRTIDGWALSADPVLQSRSFSYGGRYCSAKERIVF